MMMMIIIIIIFLFDLGTQLPRNEKKYAMQYKKVQKSSWNEPYSSSFPYYYLFLIPQVV